MKYISTRGKDVVESFPRGVLQGLARDGGLLVPETFPNLKEIYPTLMGKSYVETAEKVLGAFIDDFTEEEIRQCIRQGYEGAFSKKNLVNIVKRRDRYFLELYHGPTSAFKDFALCLLPQFMKLAIQKEGDSRKILILTATSGDTGKAALEGFKDVDSVDIVVYYPTDGISEIQRRQMVTQEGKNTTAIGIYGNFDDAQRACKDIFGDEDFAKKLGEEGVFLSSANSINIGRLLPQVVYYVYGYLYLCEKGEMTYGEPLDIVVPTGNFGNILAAIYAKKTGLPLGNFICASNENSILTDFFNTGVYDANREFYKTLSPSMDILVSSNLERYLYELTKDPEKISKYMEDLNSGKRYAWKEGELGVFGYSASDDEALKEIKDLYDEELLVDTHTAVASAALNKYWKDHEKRKALVVSTASPYKFGSAVLHALGLSTTGDDFKDLEKIEEVTKVPIPLNLRTLQEKPITQDLVLETKDIKENLLKKIKGEKS